jgi:elongation factor P
LHSFLFWGGFVITITIIIKLVAPKQPLHVISPLEQGSKYHKRLHKFKLIATLIFSFMAKVEYNQVTPKKTVTMDGDPYLVISSNIAKKDRQKASNNVRMKNLRTGQVIDKTLHQSDVLQEADITKRDVKFLYENCGEYWFCEPNDPSQRFNLSADVVGHLENFVTGNSVVEAIVFDDQIMSVLTPIKVELKVKESPEAVKGNTSSGATKEATLVTGFILQVPQFINQGDVIAVNTETGQYSERVEKA